MAMKKIRDMFKSSPKDDFLEDDYLEIDLDKEKQENKISIKLFIMKNYEDANFVLNALREGYTIAIVDIKNLKKKDPIELKRAISKIKKTVDAMEGSIAGFGESTVIITPSFAKIDKEISQPKAEDKKPFEDF